MFAHKNKALIGEQGGMLLSSKLFCLEDAGFALHLAGGMS